MRLTLAILALIVFALSFLADYKWRQWMTRRRAEHDPTRPDANGHDRQ